VSALELRRIDNTELGEARELVRVIEAYYPDRAWPLSVEQIQQSKVFYYRALREGEVIGICGIDQKTPTLAETVKTVVFHPFRGQGLGAMLSQRVEDECRSLGITKVMSTIYSFNHPMLLIKLKQGYRIEGYHPDHERPGFHEYSLGKIL